MTAKAKLMVFLGFTIILLAATDIYAVALNIGSLNQLGSGESGVEHGYVVFSNVTLVYVSGGNEYLDDNRFNRVYFTAYLYYPQDEGDYRIRLRVVNDGNRYTGWGTFHLTTTPTVFYMDLPTTEIQDTRVRVLLDAKKVS